jgi:hypothetical protein
MFHDLCIAALAVIAVVPLHAQAADAVEVAQKFRRNQIVAPVSPTTVICEAEEFRVQKPGWLAKPFGTNYYAATLANCFLSRKAYLGAPEQCEETVAVIDAQVPKAGRYLTLVRYESCYRFETRFRLKIEQQGKVRLDRVYGARDNVKIWAFGNKLKKEVAWPWGASENIVWEGHDALVDLDAGPVRLSLVAAKQPSPAARRNVDLVMLTSDLDQVKMRIEKENYLPLDGMLTQAGDVFIKVANQAATPLTLQVPNGTEHSPYWVHIRTWKPLTINAKPGETTGWIEVGSLLDTLSDGQWNLTAAGKGSGRYSLEFGLKNAAGTIESIKRIADLAGNVTLAYDADTRYSRRIRLADDVLYDLLGYLRKEPVKGAAPRRTLIYGITFTPRPGDAQYNAAIAEFIKLTGATALNADAGEEPGALVRGQIDVRGVPTPKLEEYCRKLQATGQAARIAVVSLGDEIGLAAPPADSHVAFRAWLKSRNLQPMDVDASAWDKVLYDPSPATAKTNPKAFYHSRIYGFGHGIRDLKDRTDILRRFLPNAGVGANFSPHHNHMYLGDTHHWISVFREDGMTMPWGEDYIFQVPVGSQQMNFIMVDMFRAAIRDKPGAKIHYYVMAHSPNNTPAGWRRQFYGDLAHGVKVFNLFEFRPVQAAYTENHVSSPAIYQEVRKAFHELGTFEDIVQDGQVRPGLAGLWCSETADVWDNHRAPFDAAKRCLYIAIRHNQVPLDFVVDGDELKNYRTLYLTDANVSRSGSKAIAAWVWKGGKLFATAGAGMFDEFNRPNTMLRELLGVEESKLEEAPGEPIRFAKQDLPFAKPITTVHLSNGGATAAVPVFGLRSRIDVKNAQTVFKFADGLPAFARRKVGKGEAIYCAFLPGLSYFKPAIPIQPIDRTAAEGSMTHYLANGFEEQARLLLATAGLDPLPVSCSEPRVENTVIESKHGVLIPLINWKGKAGKGTTEPIKGLTVTIRIPVPTGRVSLVSGRPVRWGQKTDVVVCTLDLDVADALVFRP